MVSPARLAALKQVLAGFPRAQAAHTPTPLEPLARLGAAHGIDLWVKRDDLTGVAFGGNKARQLEYYFGEALAAGADCVLLTSAVQSNFMRMTAAFARRFGLEPYLQLEERVADAGALYHENGNLLLDRILGAELSSYPEGEDEAGADAAVAARAEALKRSGRKPYVIPLAASSKPLGALGYVDAAIELAESGPLAFDEIVVASGSALTHAGLLTGLRALGLETPVLGACVRRGAEAQSQRVLQRCRDLEALLGLPASVAPEDVRLDDRALAPGYGRLNAATRAAILDTARQEGLFLDPVYTGKAMATLLANAERLRGKRALLWHTGGQPALFAYGGDVIGKDAPAP